MLGHTLTHCAPLPVPLTDTFYHTWFGAAAEMTG